MPHSGAVRIMFAVHANSGVACTGMPSLVPMSCTRKSLYGWMILLPSASGIVNWPPLTLVPGGAVRYVGVWHVPQPMFLKIVSPARTADVIGPRDGAFVDRMKSANA